MKKQWKQKAAALLAIAVAATALFGGAGPLRPTPASAASMETSAQVTPAKAEAGSTVAVDVYVASSETTSVLVDVEIFDESLKKVHQEYKDDIELTAGEPTIVPFAWNIPSSLPAGKYIVSLGIFGAGWSGMHKWHAGAATFEVTGSEAPPAGLPAPGNVKGEPTARNVTLTWDRVSGASAYDVEADGVLVEHIVDPSYVHQGLAPNTAHAYRVRAKDAAGAPGAWSPAVTVRTTNEQTGGTLLEVKTKTGTSGSTQMITPELEVYNVGTSSVKLQDVKMRYYFTVDGEKPLSIGFWTTAPKQYVQTKFVKMPIPSERADYYLEVGFAAEAGTLEPGKKVGIYTWINKSDWSSFNQTNDYSYNAAGAMTANSQATGYHANALAWGGEPTLYDIPPAPEGIAAEPQDTSIRVVWNPVEGATGYDVEADGKVTSNVTETAFQHLWLQPGTKHTYKVRTRKGDAVSIWSAPFTVKTTGLRQLPAPENVRGQTTSTSISLTWDRLEDAEVGYEVEADGAVIDVGGAASYTHNGLAAGTKHTYRVRAKDGAAVGPWSAPIVTNTVLTPNGEFTVEFTVDPTADQKPISPYIYGTNADLTGTENWGSRRIGGNRLSTYNWETNASNAGDDYFHQSDNYVPWYYGGVPWGGNMDEPGIGVAGFHQKSLAQGAYTLATLQTAGYVAADKNGSVSAAETAPSNRWVPVYAAKNAPLSLTPDLNDNAVYMDEFVNSLVHRFGGAAADTGIKGYEIDNEPSLWKHTHPYMHPEKPGAEEVLTKGIALTKAVKNVDPAAEMYGPVAYSFDELHSMHAAADWEQLKANYDWYLDYYLDQFRIASAQEGKRLLDAVDFHWYPEISAGGHRITDSGSYGNLEANLARMQAPRSLWDPTYKENSWIGQWYSQFLPIIPRVQQSIDQYNPGTKIAITEYNYGGEDNVYGGVAHADVLGIFGKYGVYLANFWKMTNHLQLAPYVSAAFKLFTNYDGQESTFGDTSVKAETNNIENSSIYGSIFEGNDGELHLIVMNKNNDHAMNAVFDIAGETAYTSARVFAFDAASPDITERQGVDGIQGNHFEYELPPLTVAHIVLTK